MKVIVTLIFTLLFLCSCGSKGQSVANVKLSSITAAGVTMPGGLILFGYNYETDKHQSFKFFNDQNSFILDNGKWDFFILGWSGANNLEGAINCGFATKVLDGGDVDIAFSIAPNNCTTPGTIGDKFITSSRDFNNISIESCSTLPGGGSPIFSDHCTAAPGKVSSVRVGLKTNNGQLISECQNIAPGAPITNILIPVGSSLFKGFNTQVRSYSQTNCNGNEADIFFPSGLEQDSNAILSNPSFETASRNDGIDTKVFIKDNFPNSFISTWIVAALDNVTLPIIPGYTYNFTVDWGDGSAPSVVTSDSDVDKTHQYANAGTYTITIDGTLEAWNFSSVPDSKNMILSVESLGDLGWLKLNSAFKECSNLVSFTASDETRLVTDMSNMFYNATDINTFNIENLNTTNVTSMRRMFEGTSSTGSALPINLASWDVTNVTDFSYMFRSSKIDPDTSTWDTSSATNMSNMFAFNDTANPNTLNWDTSNVTDMSQMFQQAELANPNVSSWDVSSVSDFSFMFAFALSANPDVVTWDTISAQDMSHMFEQAGSANPDVSAWDVSNVSDFSFMFASSSSAAPDTSGWSTSALSVTMDDMFNNATISSPNFSSWDFTNVISMNNMLFGTSSLTSADYSTALIKIHTTSPLVGISLDVGSTQFQSAAAAAKTALTTSPKNWIINDGGQE